MISYWIATHDPHEPGDKWFVYLKSNTRKGGVPARGDKVLFYETAGKGKDGASALVCAADVIGEAPEERKPPKGKWVYQIDCSEPVVTARTPVKAADMLALLQTKMPLHAFQGLKQ